MPFVKNDPNINRAGRPPESEEQKEEKQKEKKALKEYISEYKQKLTEALPNISPVLILKAEKGDLVAIKEIHDRVMGKAPQAVDVTSGGEKIYNWNTYAGGKNIHTEKVDEATPRKQGKVEGSSGSPKGG